MLTMLPPAIHSAVDLETTHSETVKGFLAQAIAKTDKANPHIVEAQRLHAALQPVANINLLPTLPGIQAALIAASGISDKARGHLTVADTQHSLAQVLTTIATNNPGGWKEEIVYRFLLTRGDTLGGTMRNYIGSLGGNVLSTAIVASLTQRGVAHQTIRSSSNPAKIIALEWQDRLLMFDKKPKFIDKNIDAILLNTSIVIPVGTTHLEQPSSFVACGELKGGIDPGGADEHWKTAGSAFQRVRDVFTTNQPHLFFVAAAIEASMAREIFTQLQSGRLEYAANLTAPQQLSDLTDWLISL